MVCIYSTFQGLMVFNLKIRLKPPTSADNHCLNTVISPNFLENYRKLGEITVF